METGPFKHHGFGDEAITRAGIADNRDVTCGAWRIGRVLVRFKLTPRPQRTNLRSRERSGTPAACKGTSATAACRQHLPRRHAAEPI